MANTANYTMTRNLIDNIDNVGALCAIIRSIPSGDTPVKPEPDVPAPPTESLTKGTTMTTTKKVSSKPGIDWEISVAVKGTEGAGDELAASTSGAGSGASGKVGYWVGVGFEAPTAEGKEVTKLEFKRVDARDFNEQNTLDTFGGKKGFATWGNAVKNTSISYTIKWKTATDEVVATNEYSISLSSIKLAKYEVTPTLKAEADSKVKVTFDKALPIDLKVTVASTQPQVSQTFVGDGTTKEFTMDNVEITEESATFTITSEPDLLTVNGGTLTVTKYAAIALAAATKIAATPTATAAKKTTAKKTSTKKTTTSES